MTLRHTLCARGLPLRTPSNMSNAQSTPAGASIPLQRRQLLGGNGRFAAIRGRISVLEAKSCNGAALACHMPPRLMGGARMDPHCTHGSVAATSLQWRPSCCSRRTWVRLTRLQASVLASRLARFNGRLHGRFYPSTLQTLQVDSLHSSQLDGNRRTDGNTRRHR